MSAKPTTAISELSPTDRNLWQAIVSEALAHLTYTAYAHKAMEDGLPEVAQVFQEVAGAETIHGINHLRVSGDIADTETNLTKVIEGETREYSRMYPRMIQQAHDEGRTDAVRAFTLAMEREKLHQTAFTNALAALHSAPARDGNVGRIAQTQSDAGVVEPATATSPGEAITPDLDTYITAAMEVDREPFRVANLGRLREVVFGAQDGIISTVALTTSVAAAVGTTSTVLVAGLAAIAAGVISMAAGAYLGSRAEQDVRDGEIARELRELEEKPAEEFAELVILLQREGQTYENAVHLANDIAQDQTLWLNTLLEKELGISPGHRRQSGQRRAGDGRLLRVVGDTADCSLLLPYRQSRNRRVVDRLIPGRPVRAGIDQRPHRAQVAPAARTGDTRHRRCISRPGLRAGGVAP